VLTEHTQTQTSKQTGSHYTLWTKVHSNSIYRQLSHRLETDTVRRTKRKQYEQIRYSRSDE